MSDLGDLLVVLHTAANRPLSVRARVASWVDQEIYDEALSRWESLPGNSSHRLSGGKGPNTRYRTEEWEIWHRRPGPFWRARHDGHETLIERERWWSNSLDGRFWTNVRPDGSIARNVGGGLDRAGLETLFGPSPLLAICRFESATRSTYNSRSAFEAYGSLRAERGHAFELGAPYADELKLLVDAETGVVLSAELLLDGATFLKWELTEVDFTDYREDSFFIGPADGYYPPAADVGKSGRGCIAFIWTVIWIFIRSRF